MRDVQRPERRDFALGKLRQKALRLGDFLIAERTQAIAAPRLRQRRLRPRQHLLTKGVEFGARADRLFFQNDQRRLMAQLRVGDVEFLCRHTEKATKITLPGPFTMAQQAADEHYGDDEALAMAFADVVNEELRDLAAAGADVVQLDEPWLEARPEQARRYGVKALNRALRDVDATTVVHVCFGYAAAVSDKPGAYSFLTGLSGSAADQISIEAAQPKLDLSVLEELGAKTVVLGVIDLGSPEIESPETVAARIRAALAHLPADRLVLAPDCGMKYLPRETAFGKLRALVEGAARVRAEL